MLTICVCENNFSVTISALASVRSDLFSSSAQKQGVQRRMVLVSFRLDLLNIPVNTFSVMSGRNQGFLDMTSTFE